MFLPQWLDLQNGKGTLSLLISVEASWGGAFLVQVLNSYGNLNTHFCDTEQEADDYAAKLLSEILAQEYVLVVR
jgi:hypothetical protein